MGISSLIHVIGACTRESLSKLKPRITTQQVLVRKYLPGELTRKKMTNQIHFSQRPVSVFVSDPTYADLRSILKSSMQLLDEHN